MMMDVADARVCPRRKTKPGTNSAVRVQPPLADIAIPTRFQLAYQDHFLPLNIDPNAEKVSRIRSRVQNGCRRSVTQAKSGSDINTVRLNHSFLPLPISIGATRVVVVMNIENRHVGAVEHALATVIHKTQLD